MNERRPQNHYPRCGYGGGKYQSPAQPAPESLPSQPKTRSGRPQSSFAKSLDQCFFHADRGALDIKGPRERLQAFRQLGLFVEAQGAP
jgi:hypothetical protein